MAIKIIDNISIVQAVPAVSAEITRDITKPLSFYIVGASANPAWNAVVTVHSLPLVGVHAKGP